MVNKIPAYTISAGGRIALVSSRTHPYALRIMVPACCDALEATGVSSDDIYIVEAPCDLLLPGVCRELGRSGFYSAIVALAVLSQQDAATQAILTGLTTSDFTVPVIPAAVLGDVSQPGLVLAAQEAARAAVELTNLDGMIAEMQGTAMASTAVTEEPGKGPPAKPGKRKRRTAQKQRQAAAPVRRGRPPKTAAAKRRTKAGNR